MAKVARMVDVLKRRQTYEEVIYYIENNKDRIKYPDRTAKQLINTFELSQLDGVGTQIMEQQQLRETKEREREKLLRQIASQTGVSNTEARATQQFQSPISTHQERHQEAPLIFIRNHQRHHGQLYLQMYHRKIMVCCLGQGLGNKRIFMIWLLPRVHILILMHLIVA